jgi:DNA repair photolyase
MSRLIFPWTSRSIPIAAASMDVSIVSRSRPTASRLGSISRQNCFPRSTRQVSWSGNCRLRDLDLLAPMAEKGLVKVALSVMTLDPVLARKMEPRASSPERRLDAIRRLAEAKVPTAVVAAPIIPAINDSEIKAILARAQAAGAREVGHVLLRLPLEVRDIFAEWLSVHYPDKLKHMLSLMRSVRQGKLYDSRFGARMTGSGPYAWMIGRRFEAGGKTWPRRDSHSSAQRSLPAPKSPG